MILKLQQGGASLPPFVSYLPVTVTDLRNMPSTPAVPLASTSKGLDLTDKDILEMLDKLNGLPSDMKLLTGLLLNFYVDMKYNPQTTVGVLSRYLSTLYLLKAANFNYEQYKDASKSISDKGGLNEVAINDRGQLYCMNKDRDFKLMSLSDLQQQKEYTPLTNSELLAIRAEDINMAYQNDILKVVKEGVGMNAITKNISDIVNKLGKNINSEEGYAKTKQGRIVLGLNDFIKAVSEVPNGNFNGSIEDLYKYKYLTEDQADLSAYAMRYIYNSLTTSEKTLLKIKSDGTDKGALTLIASLISSQLSPKKEFDINLVGGKTAKLTTSSASSKDNSELETSLPLNVMKGIGGETRSMMIDKGNGLGMSVEGTYFLQIKSSKDDKPIINTSLENMLAESGLQSIIKDMNNITFGDQKITPSQLHNITYNNTGLIRAELPINADGTVRLDILEDFEKALNEIKLLGENPSKEQISKIYKDNNLDDLIGSDGMPNKSKFGVFMVTEGYTTGDNGIKDSDYVKHRDSTDMSSSELDLIELSLTVGTGEDAIKPSLDRFSWYNPLDYFWGDDIYKAAIYIPINNNVNQAVYGANLNLDYDEAVNQEIKYQNFNKVSSLQSTSADLL